MRAAIQTLPRLTPPPTEEGAEAGATSTPPLVAPTPTGTMRDHDDLAAALTGFASPGRPENAYATLRDAAWRCGFPGGVGDPVLDWAHRRVGSWARICGVDPAEVPTAESVRVAALAVFDGEAA